MIRLNELLQIAGYKKHPKNTLISEQECFESRLRRIWEDYKNIYHSPENFLTYPGPARSLCDRIRRECGIWIEDNIILTALVNMRKGKRL